MITYSFRLENYEKSLAEFAAQLPEQFITAGEFSVAGFAAAQTVFGLPEEVPAPQNG